MQRLLWVLGLLLAGGLLFLGPAGLPAPVGAAGAGPRAAQTATSTLVVQDGFEGADLVTTQFVSRVPTCIPSGCGWTVLNSDHHSGAYAVHAPDAGNVSDQQLTLNSAVAIPASASGVSLTFWQHFDFENTSGHFYDGGVFEISTDDGTTWADGGALLTSGGYNVALTAGSPNPLTGRAAWGGTQSAWGVVQADLQSYHGQNLLCRFRLGTDASNSGSPATAHSRP